LHGQRFIRPRLLALRTQVEHAVVKVVSLQQALQVHIVAVLANPIEGLIERGQPLLTIQHQEGRLTALQRWAVLKLPPRKFPTRVTDAPDVPCRVIVCDRHDEVLGHRRLPDEISLKVDEGCLAGVDVAEEFREMAQITAFKQARPWRTFHEEPPSSRIHPTPA
jgi:hypothetical protein